MTTPEKPVLPQKEILETYRRFSSDYDLKTMNTMVPVINHFLTLIPPLDSSCIVHDNACGTGIVTQTIIANMESAASQESAPAKLTFKCSDISPDMINKLCEKIEKFEWTNVTATVMDSTQLTFDDESFTHSISNFGIIFVPDPVAAARHIFRTLKHGGICISTSWEHWGYLPALQKAEQLIRPDLPSFTDTFPVKWASESFVRSVFEDGGFTGSNGAVTFDRCETTMQLDTLDKLTQSWWTMGYLARGWAEEDKTKWLDVIVDELTKSEDFSIDASGICHTKMYALICKAVKF
ncbi:putative S-adenosyl-L-methionine-dependent methyltransferase [Blattamonas nauphoetae]|uniref:S-adenosyl-L-methionine-dependent methyltransferase n=1 Tax=Blattamonas nauphoetae TaxID=2049346 RepID=A0ABQ9YEM0_9EUKA|nr:putative S-adenosyl-L-methionine-dependent methyltransferase [Blattamonas nauphoetae]